MSGSSRHSAPSKSRFPSLNSVTVTIPWLNRCTWALRSAPKSSPIPLTRQQKENFQLQPIFWEKKTTSSHQQNSALKAARWYPWKLSFRQQRWFIFLQLLWFGQRFMDFEFSSRQARLPDLIYKAPPVTAFLGRRGALPLLLPRLCAFWSITTQFPSSLETSLKHSPRSGAERSLAWHWKNLKFPEISIL